MSSLTEIMQKKAAENAAKAAIATANAAGLPPPAEVKTELGVVATGMESSVTSPDTVQFKPTRAVDEEKAKSAKKVYEDLHLYQYMKNGNFVKSANGYFYAQDDQDIEILDRIEKLFGKVAAV